MKFFDKLIVLSALSFFIACSNDNSSNAGDALAAFNAEISQMISSAEEDLSLSSSATAILPDTVRFDSAGITGEFTDSRDGMVYKAVKIGDQVWMAENLVYGHDTISTEECKQYDLETLTCDQYKVQKRYWYSWGELVESVKSNNTDCDDATGDAKVYGVYFHTCPLALPAQSVCPPGWHLPSMDELQTLVNNAGGLCEADDALMSDSGWEIPYHGTDKYGFNLEPAYNDKNACINSSEQTESGKIKLLCFYSSEPCAVLDSTVKADKSNVVRCIQGEGKTGLAYQENIATDTYTGTFGSLLDPRDGKTYKTVEIGTKVWMAENLQYGDSSLYGYDDIMNATVTHCYKDSLITDEYDFYWWYPCPVKQPLQGICPDGWRLPTHDDFQELIATASGVVYSSNFEWSTVAAPQLKSTTGWAEPGIDAYGFGAQPSEGDTAYFWSSVANGISQDGSSMMILFSSTMLEITENSAQSKLIEATEKQAPVRCIKGEGNNDPMSWGNENTESD